MRVFDASSIISAWDNYPIEQFPGLWDWMAKQAQSSQIALPKVAFEEVKHKTPACADWLKTNSIELIEPDNEIIQDALRIKDRLGIAEDGYHPKGVDENDLLIIATAVIHSGELVSDESRQPKQPNEPRKMKIPLVCALSDVDVLCLNFVEFLKDSGHVFR
mgnify:CR=1 FL=1